VLVVGVKEKEVVNFPIISKGLRGETMPADNVMNRADVGSEEWASHN